MPGLLQLALAARDAEWRSNGTLRAALSALRDAADAAIDALDRAALPPPAAPEPAPVPEPPDFWQRLAAWAGEPLLVLDRESLPSGERGCMKYAVAEATATDWERKNHLRKVTP